MTLTPDLRDYLAETARRLDAAPHGQAGGVVKGVCDYLGWSPAKLYRRIKADVGWCSGRKARADKGSTSVPEAHLEMLSAAERESVRKNDKQILFTPDGAQILHANGIDLVVSHSQLNRLMRARKLNVGAQRNAQPVVDLRSEHPNQVHEVDPSLCVLYYLGGKQQMMDADKFYKNKLENYAKLPMKVWRYVLWDHASSVFAFRYYQAHGENPQTLFEFLMWAWGKQPGREFHGVCKKLIWDKGSANTSTPIKNLCDALEVETITHKAGRARVKGGVEGANNLIELKFESRLKFEPVTSVEQLNAAALAWQNAFCADLIPHQDNRLKRNHIVLGARYDLWRLIKAEQMRTLPEHADAVCRPLLEGREETRKVSPKLAISYRHPRAERSCVYHLHGLDGVCVGDEIKVRPLLYGEFAIHIRAARYDGEDLVYRVEPELDYDKFGRPMSAPIIGEEYKAKPDTAIETAAKRLDALAYPDQDADKARAKQSAPFGGTLNAHSHLADIQLPTALPRRGTELNVPMRAQVEIKPLTPFQAAGLLKTLLALAGVAWTGEHYQRLVLGWPEGVMEADLEQVATALQGQDTRQRPKLALVS